MTPIRDKRQTGWDKIHTLGRMTRRKRDSLNRKFVLNRKTINENETMEEKELHLRALSTFGKKLFYLWTKVS
jgi:hypothetical protein